MCQKEQLPQITPPPLPNRSFRRVMKPRLPRKITSSARINLNRFWNELEEFYQRYDDRKVKNNNNPIVIPLPSYTTDTFDHDREVAENVLNERLEKATENVGVMNNQILGQRKNVGQAFVSRLRMSSHDLVDFDLSTSFSCSSEEEEEKEVFAAAASKLTVWNCWKSCDDEKIKSFVDETVLLRRN